MRQLLIIALYLTVDSDNFSYNCIYEINSAGAVKEKDEVDVQQETKIDKTEGEIVYQNDETPGGKLENETKDETNEHSSSEELFFSENKETVTGGFIE